MTRQMQSDQDSLNPMQAHLGLIAATGSVNPVGIPTPLPSFQEIRHPGEVSARLVEQAREQAVFTMHAGRGAPTPPSYPELTGPGAIAGYAAQYRQNMAALNSQLFTNPFQAQMVAQLSGGQPFTSGLMPSATQFTDPSLGIFRPFPQGPTPIIPPVPPLPLLRHPLVPPAPAPRFQTPYEYSVNYGQLRADQFVSTVDAVPGVAARVGVAFGASSLGGAAGAAMGGLLFGSTGARIGSTLGALGGMALGEKTGLGQAAEHMVERVNPLRQMTYRGAQMQGMSGDFVLGGGSLSPSGVGWNRSASIHAGRLVEDLAYDPSFRSETGRQFSAQDITRVAHGAGRAGLLDFAQTPEAVRSEVRRLAKELRVFMQVANEPDVREAIRHLGEMRTFGLGSSEALSSTLSARMYSRMAGTTLRGLTEVAGLPGAMMFQEAGLSAGLGRDIGQGMYGLARQAVAGGAYSVQDLAMLGGTQGIAQRNAQSALATLRMPLLTAAMSQLSPGATSFGLDPGNIERLLRGKIGIEDMARIGVGNLHSAVGRGGLATLGTFIMQQDELQDGLGRALGPSGTRMLTLRAALEAQRTLGFDRSPGGLFMASRATGLDDQQAKQLVREAGSPEYFRNLRQQIDVQISELRGLEQDEFQRGRGGVFSRLARTTPFRDLTYRLDRMGAKVRGGFRKMNQYFAEIGEDAELPVTETYFRTPDELVADDRLHSAIRAHRGDDHAIGAMAGRSRRDRVYGGLISEYGDNPTWANFRENVLGGDWRARRALREMQGGARNAFASLEPLGRVLSSVAGGPAFATGDQVQQELLDYERGASFLAGTGTTTSSEHATALGKVAKTVGSSNIVYELASAIAKRADAGTSTLFQNGQLNYSTIREAFGDLQGKYSSTQIASLRGMSETDLQRALGPSIASFATSAGRERLRPRANEMGLWGAHRNAVGRGLEEMDRATRALFGGQKDDKLTELTKRLAAEDSDVVTFAALQEAVRQDEPSAREKLLAFLQTLPEGRRAEVERRAGLLLQGKGGVSEMQGEGGLRAIARIGSNLIKRTHGDATRMGGAVKTVLAQARESVGAFEVTRGMGLLLKDQSDVVRHYQKTGDTKALLSELVGRLDKEGRIAGLDEDTAHLVQEFKSAGSAEAKERIAGEFEDKAAGYASGNRIAGTNRAGVAERTLSERKGDLSGLERELSASFPQATSDLRDAASLLREAAIRLGGQYPTQLAFSTGD